MGNYTYAGKVPFVITPWSGDDRDLGPNPSRGPNPPKPIEAFLGWEFYEEDLPEWTYEGNEARVFTWNGWIFDTQQRGWDIKKFDELSPEVFLKGGLIIYYINADQYAAGGGTEPTFFAEDRGTLEQFCQDFGFDANQIRENVMVKQTL